MNEEKDKSLIPLKKIATELNLSKWPIWLPSHSPLIKKEKRVFVREKTLEDGSKEKIKLTLRKSGELTQLTIEDRIVYNVLEEILKTKIEECLKKGITKEEILEKKDFEVKTSLNKILKRLGLKKGSRQRRTLKQSLLRLRGTLCVWEKSFYDSKEGRTLELLDTFNILSKLKFARSKKEKRKGEETDVFILKFALNEHLFWNIVNNYTKPFYLDVIRELKSEIAQVLYNYLDLIMADKVHYERKTKELIFDDLKLEEKIYQYPSERKRKLEKAIEELQGKPLSSGKIKFIYLTKIKDEKDYKLVVEKEIEQGTEKIPQLPPFQTDTQAFELVKYFHSSLQRPNHQPTKKEIKQAKELLTELEGNLEKAKFIVNHALREAETTHFKMQFFGAILQYKEEAIKNWESKEKAREKQEAIKKCPLCDEIGMLPIFNKETKSYSVDYCPHNEEKIKSKGYEYDKKIRAWIKLNQPTN